MITFEQAQEASETLKLCTQLQENEAFHSVYMAEVIQLRDDCIEAGRDMARDVQIRAQFHRVSHAMDDMINILPRKIEGCKALLKLWKEQNDATPEERYPIITS